MTTTPDPHAALKAEYRPGQRWIYRIPLGEWHDCKDQHGNWFEPYWVPANEYRRHPDETPPEQHQQTQRWELLPRLRRLAADFQCHPLSRGITECEQAGQALAYAAAEIERLCRTRNCVVNGAGRLRRRVAELERDLADEREQCHSLALLHGTKATDKESWEMAQIIARSIRERGTEHEAAIVQMRDVADRYASLLAMWLELILFEYSGRHYNGAIGALGQYRSAMNAIQERESPTHMGEPVFAAAIRSLVEPAKGN